jgi:hypothetical protein
MSVGKVSAVAFNNLGKRLLALNKFAFVVPFETQEEWIACVIVILCIVFSDHSYIPMTLKVWILMVGWFLYLIWDDIFRILQAPPKYQFDNTQSTSTWTPSIDTQNSRIDGLGRLSVIECDFSISQAKLLEETFAIGTINSKEPPSKVLLKLVIATKSKR